VIIGDPSLPPKPSPLLREGEEVGGPIYVPPTPVPDPVELPEDPYWFVPSLNPEGSFECCEKGRTAIELANLAIGMGACHEWFHDRRHVTAVGVYKVRVRSNIFSGCIIGALAYTFPYVNRIALCKRSCCEDPEIVASYLIHEIAHHYCAPLFGREACAMSAQEECADAIRAAAHSVEDK